MTKIGKRIIIIAIPVAVSAVLLLSSVFSAAKFNTFNCFSSFPAFFGIISGSENVTEIDGGKIIMCPPADSVEKLADYLKEKALSVTLKMIWAAGSALSKTVKKFSLHPV